MSSSFKAQDLLPVKNAEALGRSRSQEEFPGFCKYTKFSVSQQEVSRCHSPRGPLNGTIGKTYTTKLRPTLLATMEAIEITIMMYGGGVMPIEHATLFPDRLDT
jgi:hypothetical protein